MAFQKNRIFFFFSESNPEISEGVLLIGDLAICFDEIHKLKK